MTTKEQHKRDIYKQVSEWKEYMSNDGIIDMLVLEIAHNREMLGYKQRECDQLTKHLRNLTNLPY